MDSKYVTKKGVEIVKVGTHQSGAGEFSITSQHLKDMVAASEGGTLPPAVVKLGHINGAVDNPEWGDGAPSYGQITNLRLSEDETTLLGDWVNAPRDLADKQASAYPNRSMEATFNMELKDESGEVAETYPAVLTGLALLGATPPAVKTLAEIHAAFSTSGHRVYASGKPVQVQASLPGDMTKEELDTALRAAVRTLSHDSFMWLLDWDDTHAFYETDDSAGMKTVRRAYTIDGNQVTWTGDPEPVVARHTFEPVQNSAGTVPQEQVSASQSERTDAAEPVATTATEGDPRMWTDNIRAALRTKFGLADTATDEDIEQAILAEATGDTGATQKTTDEAETPNTEAAAKADQGDKAGETAGQEPEKIAASTEAPGVVQLSQANFDAFIKDHADMKVKLSAIEKERHAVFVDSEIETAKRAGKIHPNDEKQIRALFSDAPEAAKNYLDGLTGVIPTRELGSNEAVYASGDEQVDEAKRAARRQLLGINTTESEAH